MRVSKTVGFSIGAAVTAVFGAIIAWGRVQKVVYPMPVEFDHVPTVCAPKDTHTAEQEKVLTEALNWWREGGWEFKRSCDGAPDITVIFDPSVDNSGPSRDIWGVDGIETLDSGDNTSWGVRHIVAHEDTRLIESAELRVHPRVAKIGMSHEIGHALGFEHPSPAAPSGCLMNNDADRMGLDRRGLTKGDPVKRDDRPLSKTN